MVIAGVASELTVAITQEAVPKVLMTVEVRGPAAMRSLGTADQLVEIGRG